MESKSIGVGDRLAQAVAGLRRRAARLRLQALVGLIVLVATACTIAGIFVALQRSAYGVSIDPKSREPYDYKLMESRHENIAVRLKEISLALADTRQELIADKYGGVGRGVGTITKALQDRSAEVAAFRSELEDRITKDRQNLLLEIGQLKAERDRSLSDGIERRSFIRLVGDAVMRVGVLILTVYVISIIANIIKYWLRVADHLSSIADSIDLCQAGSMSFEGAVKALTPHSIDFHVEEVAPLNSLKDMIAGVKPVFEKAAK